MKARTLNDEWHPFTIADVPTRFNDEEFALMLKPNSPRLYISNIRRGDVATGLFEGDIITSGGVEWLVCYERGFYAINDDRVTKHLYAFTDFQIVGNCFSREFPIPILMRSKHLFKYDGTVFRLEDIIGCYDGENLILRCCSQPVPSSAIQQDCGIVRNGERLYLGDVIDEGRVCLYKGRIAAKADDVYTDIATGGIL